MKLPSPLLLLLLFSLPISTHAIFDFFTNWFTEAFETMCHSKWNPFYLILGIPLALGLGYPDIIEIARIRNEGTVRLWGTCIIAAIDADNVRDLLPDMVEKINSGEAERINNLGLIRLDKTVFPCGHGEDTPYSDGYCGISLGMPNKDKIRIREMVDVAFGSGLSDHARDTWLETGTDWTYPGIVADAQAFFTGRDKIDTSVDAGAFFIQQIHKIALGITLTVDEARDFFEFALAVNVAALIPPVPILYGFLADADRARDGREEYLDLYKPAITARLGSFNLDASDVTLAANVMLDALIFAASPSIVTVSRGVVGAYLNDLDDGELDWNSKDDLGKVIMELVRWNPPVLGVPFEEDGKRYHSVVGYTGYDKDVWGSDALKFRIRGDVDYYRDRTLNWSDAAVPLPGKPETAFVCPARSLSFNLVLGFFEAMQLEGWDGDKPDIPRAGAGPGFWDPVEVKRN